MIAHLNELYQPLVERPAEDFGGPQFHLKQAHLSTFEQSDRISLGSVKSGSNPVNYLFRSL